MNLINNILHPVKDCVCNTSSARIKEVFDISEVGLKAVPNWHQYPGVLGGMIGGVVSAVGLVLTAYADTPQERNRGYKILAAGTAIYLLTTATNVHYFFLQGCKELAKQTIQDPASQAICRYIIPYIQC